MKKLFSIPLIFILLLNVFGYYGFFLGLQYKNERSVERSIDADQIDESKTITLKVAMSVPYMPEQSGFEKVKGKFEHNGELYRLVRQIYANDTLTIVLIKDAEYKRINKVLSEYAQAFSDIVGHQSSSKATISFIKEYISLSFSFIPQSLGWTTTLFINPGCPSLTDNFSVSIIHPPEPV